MSPEEAAASRAAVSPLPLADLLAALRSRGLPVGLREHLTVGRLLSRWDDLDVATLRTALAAILARNPQEVALVEETFGQLYAPPPPPEPGLPTPRPVPPLGIRGRRWLAWAAVAILLIAAFTFGGSLLWSHLHPPPHPDYPDHRPPTEADVGSRPPPPKIADARQVVSSARRLAGAGIAATLVFLWLYGVRTGRQAGRRGRRRWSAELDALPGPQGYDLVLRDLAPPFRADLLDDVAAVLGRRASDTPGGRELDVDRTLRRTLDAGLAPHIVLRARASTLPVLVLEDVGDEMRPHRRAVAALLAGLEERGVHLDRWCFDADADRLVRADGAALALRQLLRRRTESPLLVISTGQGILEGDEQRVAAWVPALRSWKQRTWLHPLADPRTWRPALAEVPLDVWPMTRQGLLAAARQIARGDTRLLGLREASALPERAVTPLDVDRLRWLLSLAPRRDPDLAELLRQRFCPAVPPSAIEEALAAPPLSTRPPLGLDDARVHAFLVDVLDDSRPEPGSAGYERWRLDRALQALGAEREEAEDELADLAASPLAPEVERALRKRAGTLPTKTAQPLIARVLRPLGRRAREAGLAVAADRMGVRRWTWPTLGELAAALAGATVLWFGLPFVGALAHDTEPLKLRTTYQLTLNDPDHRGPFMLLLRRMGRGPDKVDLYQDAKFLTVRQIPGAAAFVSLLEAERGHWYSARARAGSDDLAISNSVWVEPSRPAPSSSIALPPKNFERQIGRKVDQAGGTTPLNRAATGTVVGRPVTKDSKLTPPPQIALVPSPSIAQPPKSSEGQIGGKVDQAGGITLLDPTTPGTVVGQPVTKDSNQTPPPQIALGWFRLFFLDQTGNVIENAFDKDDYTLEGPRAQRMKGISDHYQQLEAGAWTVRFAQEGYEPGYLEVDVKAGDRDHATQIDVQLTPVAKPKKGSQPTGGKSAIAAATPRSSEPPIPTVPSSSDMTSDGPSRPGVSPSSKPPAAAQQPMPTNIRYSELVPIDCRQTTLDLTLKYKLAKGEEYVSAEIQAIAPDGSVKTLPEEPTVSSFLIFSPSVTGMVTFHQVVDSNGVHTAPNNTTCSARVRLAVTVRPKASGRKLRRVPPK